MREIRTSGLALIALAVGRRRFPIVMDRLAPVRAVHDGERLGKANQTANAIKVRKFDKDFAHPLMPRGSSRKQAPKPTRIHHSMNRASGKDKTAKPLENMTIGALARPLRTAKWPGEGIARRLGQSLPGFRPCGGLMD